ncbi:hypothetical protein JHK82_032626 [Glycine max]|nr:hypothetical protein JHK86_032718 [Glycine max]KAG5118206.1 hypothetical protein JHK82_032626 [Glycine max]
MEKEDETTHEDDWIKGVEMNSIDHKITSKEQQHYTVLSESDIKRHQDADIKQVSCVLLISIVFSCLLLVHHEWSVLKVQEVWFDDEERVRKAVGLLKQHKPRVGFPNSETLTCEICLDVVLCDKVRSASCDHLYCIDCWKKYVDTSINDGPNKCLKLRCPQPFCDAAVGGDMIRELASESQRNKYDQFLFRSYVENNKKVKWCPAPDCGYAVSYEADGVRSNSDVTCLCYHSFCWSCGEEAHSPVDCEIAKHWIMKNDYESSENSAWILANTKPCPKCKKPIEKIDGYVHMECMCGFQFCWLCLRKWSNCCYNCIHFPYKDIYKKEVKRNMVSDYLDDCTHYFESWTRTNLIRKDALNHLKHLMNGGHTKRLSMLYQRSEDDFEFIEAAWQQVIECIRVLKWIYTYRFYLPKSEQAKIEFLGYSQREAKTVLETLCYCTDKELSEFLHASEPKNTFDDFRLKLMKLTNVSKTYFENLVRALENGLTNVQVKKYGVSGLKRRLREIGESSTGMKKRNRNINLN